MPQRDLGLGALGPIAAKFVPELEKALLDPDTSVQKAAREALSKLRTAAATADIQADRVVEPAKLKSD